MVEVEEMRGCNKDFPLAVNHSNRCGRKTANQNSSNERRPVWKPSTLYCFGGKNGREGDGGSRGRGSFNAFQVTQEINVLLASYISTVAKTSVVIIFSTAQNSFAKATRIVRNLKAELGHGLRK